MRTLAMIRRVLREMVRDKRTLALMFLAPLFVLTLMYFLFQNNTDTSATLGVSNVDSSLVKAMKTKHLTIKSYDKGVDATKAIRDDDIAGMMVQSGKKLKVTYQNSDPSKTGLIRQALMSGQTKLQFEALAAATKAEKKVIEAQAKALKGLAAQQQKLAQAQGATGTATAGGQPGTTTATPAKPKAATTYSVASHYLYGSKNSTFFVMFLPILLGFFVFFFVFLISGISLLNERTTGTLTRLLATPIRRGEIITGYLVGYGIFALVQTLITVTFALTVFQLKIVGSVGTVLLTNLLLALVALSMGIFVSTFANSEFQMIQFIPLIVVPQVFFSGLIPVNQMQDWLQWLAHIFPLYYGGDTLMRVATKGATIGQVAGNLWILFGFTVFFTILNVVGMKRYRRV